MDEEMKIKMYALTIDCQEPYELAKFYAELLKWEIPFHDENWACIGAPGINQGAYPSIMFQRNPEYQSPVWPEEPQVQQIAIHPGSDCCEPKDEPQFQK